MFNIPSFRKMQIKTTLRFHKNQFEIHQDRRLALWSSLLRKWRHRHRVGGNLHLSDLTKRCIRMQRGSWGGRAVSKVLAWQAGMSDIESWTHIKKKLSGMCLKPSAGAVKTGRSPRLTGQPVRHISRKGETMSQNPRRAALEEWQLRLSPALHKGVHCVHLHTNKYAHRWKEPLTLSSMGLGRRCGMWEHLLILQRTRVRFSASILGSSAHNRL